MTAVTRARSRSDSPRRSAGSRRSCSWISRAARASRVPSGLPRAGPTSQWSPGSTWRCCSTSCSTATCHPLRLRAGPGRREAKPSARRRHEHRALPRRRSVDSRPGDRGLGAAVPRRFHRARRRRRARERMGAGPVSHGGAAAYRGDLRLHRRGGSAAPRVGSGSATRHPARGQHRHARRPVRQQPSGEADQLGRYPSPAGPLAAAALRVPDRRRGRQAEGARRTGDRDHRPGRAHRAPRPARGVRVSLELQLVLLLWGTLVGLDLVSVPQMMIARPIVAGPIAGAMLGDLGAGLQLGVLFELFQYDVLPMGATRYAEYGPATVAAVSAAHGAAGALGLGLGALVGLVTAMLGGLSMYIVRRATARAVHAVTDRLEAGDARLLVRLHVSAIARDALRAAAVTAAGLGFAHLVRLFLAGTLPLRGVTLLGIAAVAAALAAATAGTLRVVGRGASLGGVVAGVLGGTVLVWLRGGAPAARRPAAPCCGWSRCK